MDPINDVMNALLVQAKLIAERSYSPYTGRKEGVVVLLEDGSMVPGARVENASFQLTIPPLLNAFTTLFALQRLDFSIVVSSVAFTEAELAYTSAINGYAWELVAPNVLMVAGAHHPEPTSFVDITSKVGPITPEAGIERARVAAERAYIPESDFPVGCAIQLENGLVISAANVEHTDWSQVICAERNALSAAVAFGLGEAKELFVSCPKLPGGTPCGACRQVIVELAPRATVWMDLGRSEPQAMKATDLLPGHFTGDVLKRA